jgi:hypothetical protein
MHPPRLCRTLALLALVLPPFGCATRVYTPTAVGLEATYVDTAPEGIYAYPHVWYGDRYAYLVENHWYYPGADGWVVLRREPPELFDYRTRYVQPAPPAYRTPPAYGYPPPAVRVR